MSQVMRRVIRAAAVACATGVLTASPTSGVWAQVDPACSPGAAAYTVTIHAFPDTAGVSGAGRCTGCDGIFSGADAFGAAHDPLPPVNFALKDMSGTTLVTGGSNTSGGPPDAWLVLRTCAPPPYMLDMLPPYPHNYQLCPRSVGFRRVVGPGDFGPMRYAKVVFSFWKGNTCRGLRRASDLGLTDEIFSPQFELSVAPAW
jgi:hypothetical protein